MLFTAGDRCAGELSVCLSVLLGGEGKGPPLQTILSSKIMAKGVNANPSQGAKEYKIEEQHQREEPLRGEAALGSLSFPEALCVFRVEGPGAGEGLSWGALQAGPAGRSGCGKAPPRPERGSVGSPGLSCSGMT